MEATQMSIDRWMDKYMVQIYNGILLNHKKEQIWVSSSEVDEPETCYTERSKSKREKQIQCINPYIQNLENWHWWTYVQGRNGDADVETGLMDRVGRREWDEQRKQHQHIPTTMCETTWPEWHVWHTLNSSWTNTPSCAKRTFTNMDHILGRKTSLNKFKGSVCFILNINKKRRWWDSGQMEPSPKGSICKCVKTEFSCHNDLGAYQ